MIFSVINILFVILFAFSVLFPAKKENKQNSIPKCDSNILRGFAILAIIIHHISQRITEPNLLEKIFIAIPYVPVACFFFLSGYANSFSIKKDPVLWIKKRLTYLLFFYVIAFFINIILNHNKIENRNFIFLFFTLTIPDFTLWYVKVLFFSYIVTFILYKFQIKNESIILLFISIIYIIVCNIFSLESYWWNSIIAYPIGFLVTKNRTKMKISKLAVFISPSLIFIFFILLILLKNSLLEILISILTCTFIFSFCHFYSFRKNVFLGFVGINSFGLYLFHMVLLTTFSLYMDYRYTALFILLISIALSVSTEYFYRFFFKIQTKG